MKHVFRLFLGMLATCCAAGAWAAGQPYDKAAFERALAAGAPVVLQFHADWCPTCKAQEPVVKEVLSEPKMKPLRFFSANFDTETALKKAMHVSAQSTFVVFKGGKEVARSIGQTQRAEIEDTFSKAL